MLKNCSMKYCQKMNDIEEQEEYLYELYYATIFKKELKKFKKQPNKIEKILAVVKLLEKGGVSEIPKKDETTHVDRTISGMLRVSYRGRFTPYMAIRWMKKCNCIGTIRFAFRTFQLIEELKTNNSKLNSI